MSKLSYLNYLSNPAIVAACVLEEMGFETNEDRVTELARYCEEPISVITCKCVCGWYDFYSTLESAPDKCPRCGTELPLKEI